MIKGSILELRLQEKFSVLASCILATDDYVSYGCFWRFLGVEENKSTENELKSTSSKKSRSSFASMA